MTEGASQNCVFCEIAAGRIPASVVHRDEAVTAFKDLNPQAPIHVLLIPNTHITNTESLGPENDSTIGALIRAARVVARNAGITEGGYRLVVNTGPDAGNSVPHLHLHLLGGRRLAWPPG